MKTYSRTETIARMNALAGANVPFLFIVDYAQEQSHIEPLDRIDPATCLFQFPKAGNTETAATALARSTAARCAGPIQWDITPPSPAAYRPGIGWPSVSITRASGSICTPPIV